MSRSSIPRLWASNTYLLAAPMVVLKVLQVDFRLVQLSAGTIVVML